ncbi:MAG: hypothetical protein JWR85_1195 [Marmoricola sp.]|nr:hypothetical protein [Marmoricola sp.]
MCQTAGVFEVGGRVRGSARAFLRSYARYRPTELEQRLKSLDRLVARADPDLYALSDLARYELRGFSQNGEDGVLLEILNRIGVTNRFFVEFGIQNGSEGNCVLLADVFGWSGVFIENDDANFAELSAKYAGFPVRTVQDLVTAARIDDIFRETGVPERPDVVSIDIDGNDVYVWDALEDFRPRVIVIEYNSGIRTSGPVAQPHDPDRAWDGSGAFGSSLGALDTVARRKGYRLAHTDLTGTNAFYVDEEDWQRLGVSDVRRRNQNFGLTGITQRPATPPGGWQPVE